MQDFRCLPQFQLSNRNFLQYYDSDSTHTWTQDVKNWPGGNRSDNTCKFMFGLLQEIRWFLFPLDLSAFPLFSPFRLEQSETSIKLKLVISYTLHST